MFNKGSADFTRESPDCGLGSKSSRYKDEVGFPLHKIPEKGEEKGTKDDGSVAQNGPGGRVDLLGRPIAGGKYRAHSERYRRLQLACYNFLERPHGISHLYHAFICFLVILSLVLAALSTIITQQLNYWAILHTPVFIVESILVAVFVVEYCLRLWAAGCRSSYVGLQGRIKFAKKIYTVLDIIVIISSICALALLVTAKVASTSVSLIRFLPLLRVLRFDRQGGTWKLLASVIYIHRKELVTTLYLGFISLIFSSFVLYMVEKDENSKFDSWPNSFWWGIVTLTTIGYGDKTPITWYGRLCAAFFAVFGISFFALPAGILGSGFALKVTQQQRQKHFHRRRRPAAILLQSHWRMYCADINSKSVATWLPHIYYSRPGADKMTSSATVDSNQTAGNVGTKKTRKLSSVWKSRNEGKTSRSQSIDATRGSRSDSTPMLDTGGLCGTRPGTGSTVSTLDTGFFDEANISMSEDGEPAIMLNNAQKHAIRLIRLLKLNVAIRKFKEARKPYDVKDVIEQYSTGHVEMLSRMKNLQQKIDKVHVEKDNRAEEESSLKSNIDNRLYKVEQQVSILDRKVDVILSLLSRMSGLESGSFDTNRSGPTPPPGGSSPGSSGIPTVIVGADQMSIGHSRLRSESLPLSSAGLDSVQHWPPKHSQSDPVMKIDGMNDVSPHGPRTSSLSSEESYDNQDMDCLGMPGASSVTPSRILGVNGRQLSDVTEGDESVASSDSKENVLGSKFSRESTLDSIQDDNEQTSPVDDLDLPMYDPLLNPHVPDPDPPIETDEPFDTSVWEKKSPVEPRRRRTGSQKTSSTGSFGTLVGSGNGSFDPECSLSDAYQGSQDDGTSDKEVPGASPQRDLIDEDPPTFDADNSVTSGNGARAKRRTFKRASPVEV